MPAFLFRRRRHIAPRVLHVWRRVGRVDLRQQLLRDRKVVQVAEFPLQIFQRAEIRLDLFCRQKIAEKLGGVARFLGGDADAVTRRRIVLVQRVDALVQAALRLAQQGRHGLVRGTRQRRTFRQLSFGTP